MMLTILFVLSTSLFASDELCSLVQVPVKEQFDLSLEPDYFVRPLPDSDQIAAMINFSNYLVDLKTGEKKLIPGQMDAYPMPDGRTWVIPVGNGQGLEFYDIDSQTGQSRPILNDYSMTGSYQSVGMTSPESFRVLIDPQGIAGKLKMKDYEITANGIRPKSEAPKVVCHNLGRVLFSLPMISKDGSQLSVLNGLTQTTQIYRLNPDGSCALGKDLGIKTGKVDFSYDNQSIAFHTISVFNSNSGYSSFIKKPLSSMVSNAWVMDLKSDKSSQLTHFNDTSALYPAFNKKGEVLVRKFKAGGVTILKINPKDSAYSYNVSSLKPGDPECFNKPFMSLYALGEMLREICMADTNLNHIQTSLLVGNLDKKSCLELVKKWRHMKSEVREKLSFSVKANFVRRLSEDDLKGICPTEDQTKGSQKIIVSPLKIKTKPDLTKIPSALSRCVTCHGSGSVLPLDFEHVTSFKQDLKQRSVLNRDQSTINVMLDKIISGAMPPPNSLGVKGLTEEERNEVIDWLQTFKFESHL